MTFPSIEKAELLALDIETHDPDLVDLGPGPRRPDGRILGVGVADGRRSWYFSVSHPDSDNVALPALMAWLNGLQPRAWVGANLLYDLDWLTHYGMKIGASKLLDVQLAEPLIDENKKHYNLDSLGLHYTGIGKAEEELTAYCMRQGWRGKPQQHLSKMSASLVGPYCQRDCEVTFDVLEAQKVLLERQNLTALFELECDLLPLLLHMRHVGVRVNTPQLVELREIYQTKIAESKAVMRSYLGCDLNVGSSRALKDAFLFLGIPEQKNEEGRTTFDDAALQKVNHPIAGMVRKQRHAEKTLSSFIDGLERHIVKDRIHCQFHPLRGDEYGTISGRFSSSNPNLQQMPSRDDEAKKDIRGLFTPEEGCSWLKLDYSQIELRVLAHYARGRGANEIRKMYQDNPEIDFHQACADMIGVERKIAKSINFGVVYGMGIAKMAKQLGIETGRAAELIGGYHQKMPFLKNTSREVCNIAESRGYIKTLLGRRRWFPDKRWCYKALNALIQGSAADIMKKAMVDAWKAGVFDTLIPHITVHDELDCSVPLSQAGTEAVNELKHICETAIPLSVPLIAECEMGSDWSMSK